MLRSLKGWIAGLLKMLLSLIEGRPDGEEFFSAVFLCSPLPTIICKRNYEILEVNNALCETLGYERWELINKPLDILIPRAAREKHRTVFDAYLTKPSRRPMAESGTLGALHREGHEISVNIELAPVYTEGHTFAAATLKVVGRGGGQDE